MATSAPSPPLLPPAVRQRRLGFYLESGCRISFELDRLLTSVRPKMLFFESPTFFYVSKSGRDLVDGTFTNPKSLRDISLDMKDRSRVKKNVNERRIEVSSPLGDEADISYSGILPLDVEGVL